MRRRQEPRGHRHLHPAGDGARPGRQPARRPARAPGGRRHSARAWLVIIASGRGALRRDVERGAAGYRDRRTGVAAVFDRAALARAIHQAVAAAPRGIDAPAARLGWSVCDWRRRRGAGRAHDLAGRIASRRPCRVRGLHRSGIRAALGRPCTGGGHCAAGEIAVLPAASRGAAPVASGQSDPRDSARRRTRRLLHRRHPLAAGQPARRVLGSNVGGCTRHVSARYPEDAGRRHPRIHGRSGQRRRSLAASAGSAGARGRH